MSKTKPITGKSVQKATSGTSETLATKGVVIEDKARRIRIAFDLNAADPADNAIIGRYTYDGQPATETFGTQFQFGSVLNFTPAEADEVQFIKLAAPSAVNFMVDQFNHEQGRG